MSLTSHWRTNCFPPLILSRMHFLSLICVSSTVTICSMVRRFCCGENSDDYFISLRAHTHISAETSRGCLGLQGCKQCALAVRLSAWSWYLILTRIKDKWKSLYFTNTNIILKDTSSIVLLCEDESCGFYLINISFYDELSWIILNVLAIISIISMMSITFLLITEPT